MQYNILKYTQLCGTVLCNIIYSTGKWDSLLVECQTRDQKVVSLNPGRSEGRIFFFIWCPFHPVLPQWHIKDSGHSANGAGGRLHLSTHSPVTQRSQSGLTTLLSRHSVGTYQETSSHTTHQGNTQQWTDQETSSHTTHQGNTQQWTDPGPKSGISVRELI